MRLGAVDSGHCSWEDLRKQACHLENDIDLKLVQFSKLGTNYLSVRSYEESTSDRTNASRLAENMSKELQLLISQLTRVNERMSDWVHTNATVSQTSTYQHTLQRHWDIAHDYSNEFHKIGTNISALRDRTELLNSLEQDISSSTNADLYMKEHDLLLSSDRLVEEQLSVAAATRENLQAQKMSLYGVAGKMNSLTNRFPAINNLIQKLNFHKRRDAIILGIVISLCIICLLWYALH